MEGTRSKVINRAASTQPAAAAKAQETTTSRAAARSVGVQTAMKVSSPQDPAEKEAESTAKKIMRMAAPQPSFMRSAISPYGTTAQRFESPYIARFSGVGLLRQSADEKEIQRQAEDEQEVQRQAEDKREVQRQSSDEEQEVQRQAEDEQEIQRQANDEVKEIQRQAEDEQEVQRQAEDKREVQRQSSDEEPEVQRQAEGQPDVGANVQSEIQSSLSAGRPLPLSVRRFMEPRFGADFSGVKIHTDTRAAGLNRRLSARAFAVGKHIFFGEDQFRPETSEGKELIAHELTHTVQQGATVQRSRDVKVGQSSPVMVQRLGVQDALDYFADKANLIPGYRMFTIILGINPINMRSVERSAANILRAIVEFMPGGGLIVQALDRHGVFERAGTWIEQQISALGLTGSAIRASINAFLDSLSWRDIFRLGGVWRRAKRIFTTPIRRLITLARRMASQILQFIKDAILIPLARLAQGTRGYDLLRAILGQDPISGEAVPRTADTLIGGFMKLIGQEEIWNNLKKAKAVPRAWAWFQGALQGLMGFVRQVPALVVQAFRTLEVTDLLLVPRAFVKIGRVFLGFVGRFFSWAGQQVMSLLQIIFEVVAPGVMPFLRRARGAFSRIIRNPVGFIRNLVRAGILGFRKFARNFLKHLKASIIGWITGALGGTGIHIPTALTFQEIIKFVLSVLGLTWQNIRVKLVRVMGETAVAAMETGFELVVTLVTQGPAAAWEKIKESLGNLKEMVMEQIMTFVSTRIVQAAITRLLTSLNPAGAFIQAIIAIYNTVMFFVERLRQIGQVAVSIVNSIVAIANGQLNPASNRVERTLAGMLTLVISFLARLVGLGNVSTVVTNIVNRIRAPIDRALDRVINWIVSRARRFLQRAAQAGLPEDPHERLEMGLEAAARLIRRLPGNRLGQAAVQAVLPAIKLRYGFTTLQAEIRNGKWWVVGEINPPGAKNTDREAGEEDNAGAPQHDPARIYVHNISSLTSTDRSVHTRSGNAALRRAAQEGTELRRVIQHYQSNWFDTSTRNNPSGLEWDHTTRELLTLMTEAAHSAHTRSSPGGMGGYALYFGPHAERNREILARREQILRDYPQKVVYTVVYTGSSSNRSAHRSFGNIRLLRDIRSKDNVRARIVAIDSEAESRLSNGRNVLGHEWNHRREAGNSLDLLPASYHFELTSVEPGRVGGFAQRFGNR